MAKRTPAQDRWLRFNNDILYDRFPLAYNALDRLTFGTWWKLVARALDFVLPADRLLEIGFGPGRLHLELAHCTKFCMGLDLAWGMCRFTQRRLSKARLISRLVRGSVFALPYVDNTFDTVVSTFAFSGFSDGNLAMSEIARVMAPGGNFILVDIGLPQDGNRLGSFLAHLWERMGDFLYNQPFLMQGAGLEVTDFEEYGPGDHIRVIVGHKRNRGHQREIPTNASPMSI